MNVVMSFGGDVMTSPVKNKISEEKVVFVNFVQFLHPSKSTTTPSSPRSLFHFRPECGVVGGDI